MSDEGKGADILKEPIEGDAIEFAYHQLIADHYRSVILRQDQTIRLLHVLNILSLTCLVIVSLYPVWNA